MVKTTERMVPNHGAPISRKHELLREFYSDRLSLIGRYKKAFPDFKPYYAFTAETPGTYNELSEQYNRLCWQLEQYREQCGRIESDPEQIIPGQMRQRIEAECFSSLRAH